MIQNTLANPPRTGLKKNKIKGYGMLYSQSLDLKAVEMFWGVSIGAVCKKTLKHLAVERMVHEREVKYSKKHMSEITIICNYSKTPTISYFC